MAQELAFDWWRLREADRLESRADRLLITSCTAGVWRHCFGLSFQVVALPGVTALFTLGVSILMRAALASGSELLLFGTLLLCLVLALIFAAGYCAAHHCILISGERGEQLLSQSAHLRAEHAALHGDSGASPGLASESPSPARRFPLPSRLSLKAKSQERALDRLDGDLRKCARLIRFLAAAGSGALVLFIVLITHQAPLRPGLWFLLLGSIPVCLAGAFMLLPLYGMGCAHAAGMEFRLQRDIAKTRQFHASTARPGALEPPSAKFETRNSHREAPLDAWD